jgi:glucosylceramidase
MLHGGKLKPVFRQAWANYYAKFIKAYDREGIHIWGTSVQNEPMATQTWESCIYTAEEERDFIKGFLGPTLAREGWATARSSAGITTAISSTSASAPSSPIRSRTYVWGIGFHWYEPWSGGSMMFDNVRLVREPSRQAADLHRRHRRLLQADDIHNWRLGEYYGRSMINDFNDGAVGWTDWNVLLDEQGGPNHVGNFCFAPVARRHEDG